MSFPTTSILDAFNRADENPLSGGGNWSAPAWWSANPLELAGNRVRLTPADPTGYAGAEWHVLANGAVELYIDVPVASVAQDSSDYFELDLVDDNSADLGSPDGYVLGFAGGPPMTLVIGRYDAGAFTSLANSGLTLVDGDAVGIAYDPATNVLRGYRRHDGVWAKVMQATDATYAGPWHLQIGITGEVIRLDTVGGGSA